MRSELAVITCYVVRYRCAGFAKISVSIIRHPFCFQASKKTVHRAVIPEIPPATQALLYLISPQYEPPRFSWRVFCLSLQAGHIPVDLLADSIREPLPAPFGITHFILGYSHTKTRCYHCSRKYLSTLSEALMLENVIIR